MTPFTLRALLLSTALVATPALAHDRSQEPHDPLLRVSQDAVALTASGDTSGDEPGAALQRAAASRTLGIALLRDGRARGPRRLRAHAGPGAPRRDGALGPVTSPDPHRRRGSPRRRGVRRLPPCLARWGPAAARAALSGSRAAGRRPQPAFSRSRPCRTKASWTGPRCFGPHHQPQGGGLAPGWDDHHVIRRSSAGHPIMSRLPASALLRRALASVSPDPTGARLATPRLREAFLPTFPAPVQPLGPHPAPAPMRRGWRLSASWAPVSRARP